MKFPDVVHPRRIHSQGCVFEVVAYCKLTDRQALKIVRQHLLTHKVRAKDRGKVVKLVTTFDRDSAALL